jgi:segregation and condensation protein B
VAAIRGVNSDSVLNSLIEKGLVSIAGRKAGRSLLFSTTNEFLQQFGLKDASELPSLDEIDELLSASNGSESRQEPPPAVMEESTA